MIRTSLSRAPSSMTAEQRRARIMKRRADLWHASGGVFVPTQDPSVPAHLRIAAEAYAYSLFGPRKPTGGSGDD